MFPLGINRLATPVLKQRSEIAEPVLFITGEKILRRTFDRTAQVRYVDYQALIHRRHPPGMSRPSANPCSARVWPIASCPQNLLIINSVGRNPTNECGNDTHLYNCA